MAMNLEQTKARIKSVASTKKITKSYGISGNC